MTTVDWRPWKIDAFDRARAEDKPVLLSIAASWCESCGEMDRTTYADRAIVDLVNDRFVPVRVDADRRPDICERYSLGGWPTTAFLTAEGDILGGGTYVAVERMPEILSKVADAFKSRRAEIATNRESASAPTHGHNRPTSAPADLRAVVFGAFDAVHGGFGTAPKFPLTAPLDLALRLVRDSQDEEMSRVVESTLDAMGWGALYDDIDGGFFRCAASRDWTSPHREKLLLVNAEMIRVYVEASRELKISRYRDRALEVLRYVQTWLADPVDGGWGGSQRADAAYYAASEAERRALPTPPVDSVLYAGWNAAMVSAALRAAEAFDDVGLGEFAMRSLERVVLAGYRPGAGVAHCLDGEPSVRGLLDDQVAMIDAHLDAHAATGNIVYQMLAQELAHYIVRTMWDDDDGGFFDRGAVEAHERIGLLCERRKLFVSNCDAARVLRRLADTAGDHDFGARAEATLAAMAPLAAEQGPLAAHFLLAQI